MKKLLSREDRWQIGDFQLPKLPIIGFLLTLRLLARLMSDQPHEGSCEEIENRLLPAPSVRRGTAVPRARSTQVERELCARFHLWIRRRDRSGLAQFDFSTALGCGAKRSFSAERVRSA